MFLNVDLELASKDNLAPLVAALGKNVVVLHAVRHRGRHKVNLELSGSPKTASAGITRFVKLLHRLPGPARRLWVRASVRDFNVGVRAGLEPHSAEFILEKKVLNEVVRLGGGLVFTVYPFSPEN